MLNQGDEFVDSLANEFATTLTAAINWVNVENANTLQNMLSDIATGKKTVAKAAADASDEITKILNA